MNMIKDKVSFIASSYIISNKKPYFSISNLFQICMVRQMDTNQRPKRVQAGIKK